MLEPRKPIRWRAAAIFASGLLLGGMMAAWAVLHERAPATPAAPLASKAGAAAPAATSAAKPVVPAARALGTCPAGPAVAAAGVQDGHLRTPGDPSGKGDFAALILGGKEAAASGRPRDAEVSFLAACRASDQLHRADSIEPADARYQLGRHYANVVLNGGAPAANRAELTRRAELLYADSLHAYRARFGEGHEKTRFAAEGLATLRQSVAQVAPAAAPAAVAPAPRTVAVVPPKPAVAVAPPRLTQPTSEPVLPPVRQVTVAATRGRPSFDCALARSPSERAICADGELARLDRDLGRLHARARMAAGNSEAFRRQNDREWRRREATCQGDRECLREWYARRRDQLLEDVEDNRQ